MIRTATADDVNEIRQLVLCHGDTQWHYFPKEALEKHLKRIASGTEHAVIAFDNNTLVGMVSFAIGEFYLEYEHTATEQKTTGYIVDAIIHSNYLRLGIGSQLLDRVKKYIEQNGVDSIYAQRHEDNKASEALLRKAGFLLIDVFKDPNRTTGSGKTVVERFSIVP